MSMVRIYAGAWNAGSRDRPQCQGRASLVSESTRQSNLYNTPDIAI